MTELENGKIITLIRRLSTGRRFFIALALA
jgi:hypothetical protein